LACAEGHLGCSGEALKAKERDNTLEVLKQEKKKGGENAAKVPSRNVVGERWGEEQRIQRAGMNNCRNAEFPCSVAYR